MTLEIDERGDDGAKRRQPVLRRRAEQRDEVAVRQVFEHEHRGAVVLDELVRLDEVRARDGATARRARGGSARSRAACRRQLALRELQRGLTAVGRNGMPDLGRAAAAERRDGVPTA